MVPAKPGLSRLGHFTPGTYASELPAPPRQGKITVSPVGKFFGRSVRENYPQRHGLKRCVFKAVSLCFCGEPFRMRPLDGAPKRRVIIAAHIRQGVPLASLKRDFTRVRKQREPCRRASPSRP